MCCEASTDEPTSTGHHMVDTALGVIGKLTPEQMAILVAKLTPTAQVQ